MNEHPGSVPPQHARDDVRRPLPVLRLEQPSTQPAPTQAPAVARVKPQPRPRTPRPIPNWAHENLRPDSPSPYSRMTLRLLQRFGTRACVLGTLLVVGVLGTIIIKLATVYPAFALLTVITVVWWFFAIGTHPAISVGRTMRDALQNMIDRHD